MGRLEVEVQTKSPADKVWEAIKDTHNIFPKIFPNDYKSVDVLEGDGKSVGSVILTKYVEGAPHITFSKERIEEADEGKKYMAYKVIDGELTNLYKTFKASLQIIPEGDGSLVKWSVDYEKVSEEVPEPSFVKEFAVKTFKGLDAYITP